MAEVAPPPYSTSAGYTGIATAPPQSTISAFSGSQQRLLGQIELSRKLKATINETHGASQEYERQIKSVQDLKNQLAALKPQVSRLTQQRRMEEIDVSSYRNSFIKKTFMSKEKFAGRQEKEEKEYQAALEKEQEAKQRYESIEDGIRGGEKLVTELESQSSRYQTACNELDELYSDIFDGPTREAPEEDRLEAVLKDRRAVFEQANTDKLRESSAADALKDALFNLQEAKNLSAGYGYGNAGVGSGMGLEEVANGRRDLSHKLEWHYETAKRSLDHARASYQVGSVPYVPTPMAHGQYDGTTYYGQLKETNKQLGIAIKALHGPSQEMEAKVAKAAAAYDRAKRRFEISKVELDEERARAVEHVLNTRIAAVSQ